MRLSRPSLLPSRPRLRALGIAAAAVLFALRPTDAAAQCVSLTTPGSAYTQNFDTLSNTAGSTTNNLTITGWFMTESGGGARDNEQYAVDTGASTTGDTYSYGSAASTERALGQLRSGTLIPNFGSCYTNNTGTTITSLQIAYNGEQWRLGTAARTDQMSFEYSTNATDLVTGTWSGVAALNFVTPDTATAGAKNGNAAADRTALSSTISSLSIANGATFWIRWADTDASGADDGLAVDDFSLTPQTAVVLPNLTINDVSLNEGNAGTTSFTFTVSLSAPAGPGGVTFDIATANGTAVQPGDYTQKSLTSQTIPAGSSTYSFTVLVNGDTTPETNETFFVNVTNVTGASVTDGQGQATIVNDDAAPNLTVNDVSLNEGNAGTTTFTFTVSLSAPAGAGGVTFDMATADGTATQPGDYTQKSLTGQTIPAGSSTYTFDVLVNGDASQEANETFFVNISNITNAIGVDTQGQGTIANDDFTPIHDIQGNGSTSPLVGTSVIAQGIVTGLKSNGFFLQEPDASADADPNTSEGIFVFTSSAPPVAAVIGNRVQVTATVQEFIPSSDPASPPTTELVSPTVALLSSGNPLPTPVVLNAAATTQPSGTSNPLDSLEEYEGMRVTVPSLTVTGSTQGTITEPSATVFSTGVFIGVITGVPRPFREAGIAISDALPAGAPGTIPRFDENPERIRVDSDAQPGATTIDVTAGTVVTNITGPLDYAFRCYTIDPDAATPPSVGTQPGSVPVPAATSDELTVASFNMERFFDTVNDPGSDPVLTTPAFNRRVAKASLIVRTVQRYPDVIGVQEMENLTTLQAVAAQINNDAVTLDGLPNPNYTPYLFEGNDVGGIDVGFLVKAARVTTNSVTQLELGGCDHVTASACYNYNDPNTGTLDILNDRPPLVLSASIPRTGGGGTLNFTVIVNHLRSLNNVDDNTPAGTGTVGARVREKRRKQAEFLANYIQGRQVADPSEVIVTVGDMNAFRVNDGYVDSIGTILGTPASAAQVVLPSADLVNPDQTDLVDTLSASDQYSYNFDGNAQTLDHIIVNAPALAILSRFAYARDDSDFAVKNYESTNELRISDHDQPVAYFSITSLPIVINPTSSSVSLSSATLGGNATHDGGTAITERGVVYAKTATNNDPSIGGAGVIKVTAGSGTGIFTTPVTGLLPATGYSFKAYATNSLGTGYTPVATFTTTTCPLITLSALGNGTLGVGYAGSASAAGGVGPYSYALTSGTLPAGLLLNNPAAGDLSGTPAATGTFTFQITATDANTCTGVANYSVVIGSAVGASDLVIREFRLRGPVGPNSATDEYVVVHNRTASPIVIASIDGSTGFALASSDGNPVFTIPNGTVISPKGFFLGVNTTGFSLAGPHDASWTADIADGLGLGLFRTAFPGNFGGPTVIDAAGFTGGSAPYIEGAGLTSLGAATGEYAWVRKAPAGPAQDTGVNANDFQLVATDGAAYNGVQSTLGAPAPANGLFRDVYAGLNIQMAEPLVGPNLNPNRIRTGVLNSGTLEFRRRITNNTGSSITAIRLRVNDLSTLNSGGYTNPAQADLRPGSGPNGAIPATSIGVTSLTGLTLSTPPSQPIGGGVNSVLLLPAAPLANGASIDINIVLNISRVGSYRFFITVEAQ